MLNPTHSRYRWYILALCTLTNLLVIALQTMCMPVLFNVISVDLNLDLVQVGLVWGIVSLPGMLTGLLGGAAGDRFGPKRVLVISCLLAGLFGALRGLAFSFASLLTAMFLFGMMTTFIPMIVLKTCGMWFDQKQMGLASGVVSTGMAFGFLTGSLISATVLAPILGGWRNVLIFYGVVAMLLSIPWLFSRSPVISENQPGYGTNQISLSQSITKVARIRNVWLFGILLFGINGCVQGAIGYLPLYLNGLGWSQFASAGANAIFYTTSMIFAIPIALLSDRFHQRHKISLASGLLITMGVGFLALVQGPWIWLAVCLAGLAGDGFMAVTLTSVMETRGIGTVFAGAALGLVMAFSRLGTLLSPSLGNSLAEYNPSLPFLMWAGLGGVGLIGLLLIIVKGNHASA
jgi:MFS family permease